MKTVNPIILVIDDEPDDIFLIQSAFRAIGIPTIQTVDSGDEARAYLAGQGRYANRDAHPYPEFVITDLKMPNGDGFSVLEHFKQHPEWAVIPTVVLSGSQDNDDIKRAYLLGASSYHVKPSSPAALRTLVKTLHDYWTQCEVPEVERNGKHLETDSSHKLGKRFGKT